MEKDNIKTDKEMVFTISNERGLVAMVRKDPISRKNLVYHVKEMNSEDITKLVSPSFIWPKTDNNT